MLQTRDHVMSSEGKDGEKPSISEEETCAPEDEGPPPSDVDTICGDDKEYQPDSSSSEDEDIADTAVESVEETEEQEKEWMSRDGKITWLPTDDETLRYKPAPTGHKPGPTLYAISRISDIGSAFDLFITEAIIKLLCTHTNLHGKRKSPQWKDVDGVEMRAYIGILILAGVYRSRHEATSSIWDSKTGRPIFLATMPLKRFAQISANIRFDDKLARKARFRDDKLAAFRVVWEKWVTRLPMLFNPGVDVCVDEQLVSYKGHCRLRQYMPKKPAKYGIKIWVICDVETSYAWRMQIYTGKPTDASREVKQGMRVTLDLTEGLKGHTVTCDNFFTSFSLAEELLRRKMALVGTIRKNKPELPPKLVQLRRREILSSLFAFTKTSMAVSYVPKQGRNVLLLSTKHRQAEVSNSNKKKPVIILDYNKCKGGVDTLDKVVGTYSCRRKTSRWPLALFYNMLDVSAYNAFVLWRSVNPDWESSKSYRRRLFLEQLGHQLVTPEISRRSCLPRSKAAATVVTEMQQSESEQAPLSSDNTRRRCKLCTTRRRTTISCSTCGRFVCKDHSTVVCKPCYQCACI